MAVSTTLPGAGLSTSDFGSLVTAITSAFGDPTRRDIYLHVLESPDGATAAEVAEGFAVHPNVARHHLDKLVAGGYLEVTVRKGGSGAGRPSKRYHTTRKDVTIDLPIRHDDILVTLLGRALAMVPRERAEAMAEEVGLEFGRAMAGAMGDAAVQQRSFRSALHAVADALTAHGFSARAEGTEGSLRIVAAHCPFGDAAIEHPVICAVDRGLVRGMLSSLYGVASAELESSLPMGDSQCVTTVEGEDGGEEIAVRVSNRRRAGRTNK